MDLPDPPGVFEAPDNEAMRLYELRILHYLDEKGDSFTSYAWIGQEPTYVEAIGMVESAKLAMHFVATHHEESDES